MTKFNLMNRLIISLLTLSVFITACGSDKEITKEKPNKGEIFSKVYTPDNIPSQNYMIMGNQDTVLVGESGTIIQISKNTFINSKGETVAGEIEFELKEVLTPSDMVLCNLTTTSNGQFLQSGGMIYTNATSKGENLQIAENSSIGVEIPCDSIVEGMKLYEGIKDSTGINWVNPSDLGDVELPVMDTVKADFNDVEEQDEIIYRTNVAYKIEGINSADDYPLEVKLKVQDLAWGGKGLVITKDSFIKVNDYTVKLIKLDSMLETRRRKFNTYTPVPVKGTNTFVEDNKTKYIFSLKKLGWANIDRLFNDPRTKEVELITSIDNQGDFENVYVSMIVSNQKMYLPGYQKKDDTYSFTHDDNEKPLLPIGEHATFLATAYKDDTPYFVIKKIIISEKQKLSLNLEATTMEKLKVELQEKI